MNNIFPITSKLRKVATIVCMKTLGAYVLVFPIVNQAIF